MSGNDESIARNNDIQKKDVVNKDKAENVEPDFSAFERALADLLVWYESDDDDSGEWRVRQEYRGLFACLTPRQIKSFLRERLLAASGGVSTENTPAVLFLRTLFHPLWRVRRDERALFSALMLVADAALKLLPDDKTKADGKLSGPASDIFFLQLQATASKSTVLTDEDVRACWPRKSEERALLLYLLAAINWEDRLGGRGTEVSSGDFKQSAAAFAEWARTQLGERPAGVTVAEQVSSFQDKALAQYRRGDKRALQAVANYADTFLQRHEKFFDASTASSLSNLAVLINDAPGQEAQCDHLFHAAVKLARPDSRVPFYHVEFLLDVLEEQVRLDRLIPARYTGEPALVTAAEEALAGMKDEALEPNNRLYRDILLERLASRGITIKQTLTNNAWNLAKRYAATLIAGGREPSSRFNDLLDSLIGKGGVNLSTKEPLQGAIWAAQVKTGNPGWPMAIQIANDLVAESAAKSGEEKIGLRLNAALLGDTTLLDANENARLAGIWSQTGSLLSQWIGTPAKSRIALAFLAGMACGGSAQASDRMRKAWERLGEQGDGQKQEDWQRLLDSEHRSLFEAFEGDPHNTGVACELAETVFGTDFPPIKTPDELMAAMGWGDMEFDWAGRKDFNAAVDELVVAAGIKQEAGK